MKNDTAKELRVLAIDPSHKGFGYAVLEGPNILIDWEVKEARVTTRILQAIEDLLGHYEPDFLIVEDCGTRGCRRGKRARMLIESIIDVAAKRNIRTKRVMRLAVKESFGLANKHEIAKAVAERFPELAPRVFPYRRTWMSEDYRTPIFDAVAFALTFFQNRSKQKQAA